MWISFIQIKGLCATGLLAVYGVLVTLDGFAQQEKWNDRIGWFLIGAIFWVPFIAVLVSVVISRR